MNDLCRWLSVRLVGKMRGRISHPAPDDFFQLVAGGPPTDPVSATRPTEGVGGREGDVSPGGSRPAASIASCKVTAVKFSAPPLNFSGIPIYSAARIYLFRASSLSLRLVPRPHVSRGGSLLSSIPFFARYPSRSRTHTHTLSVLPVSLSLLLLPLFSLRFSISVWLTRNSVQRAAESRAGERVHVRRAFVAHARL